MRTIYRTFDLPVKLHESDTDAYHLHDITPKAKHKDEIDRRRNLQPGTLCIERLQRGTAAASSLLELVREDNPEDTFITQTLAAAAFNSSWYSLAEGSTEVMRRQLSLPVVIEAGCTEPVGRASLALRAGFLLDQALRPINTLRTRPKLNEANTRRGHTKVGRMLGNASMLMSAADAELPSDIEPAEASHRAREQAKHTQHQATNLHTSIGKHPSLASLATPYSDMSVYWMRNVPASLEEPTTEILRYYQMAS